MTSRYSILVVTLVFLAALRGMTILGDTPDGPWNIVDANGTIRKPLDLRDLYQTLGTYMVLALNGNEMYYIRLGNSGARQGRRRRPARRDPPVATVL
jgi:hypothetical protein